MIDSNVKRYDGERMMAMYKGFIGEKRLRKLMKQFRRNIDMRIASLGEAVRSKDRDDPYIGHTVRDFFQSYSFMRAGQLANFIYRNNWEDDAVSSAMSELEAEAKAVKLIVEKILRDEIPIESIIDYDQNEGGC